MPVTSTHNPAVKLVRSLARAPIRRKEGVYLAEGVRLVSEALSTRQYATLVLYDPAALSHSAEGSFLLRQMPSWADTAVEVDARVLEAAAQTESPGGVIAVLRFPSWPDLATAADARFSVILDQLGDPGNAGTILRTADAFGADFVITTPGTVDLFSPKVVRAGMGAHFRLPAYAQLPWDDIRTQLRDTMLVGSDAEQGQPVQRFEWPRRTGLVVGSEATGLSPEARDALDAIVRIPIRSGVESLNAATATSILLFAGLSTQVLNEDDRYR